VSAVVIAALLGAGLGSMWFDRRPTAIGGALCGSVPSQNCVVDGDTIYHGGVKIWLAEIGTQRVPRTPAGVASVAAAELA